MGIAIRVNCATSPFSDQIESPSQSVGSIWNNSACLSCCVYPRVWVQWSGLCLTDCSPTNRAARSNEAAEKKLKLQGRS